MTVHQVTYRPEEWAEYVRENRSHYVMTPGVYQAYWEPRSPFDGDFFLWDSLEDGHYCGTFLTHDGFVDVRFPVSATRPPTDHELEWLAANPAFLT